MKKKKKNKPTGMTGAQELARFGNFLIKKYGDGQNLWVRVMSVDNTWRMDFRDDSLKYGWIITCLQAGTEGVLKALEMWIIIAYHTAQVWPDPEYLNESSDCLNRLQERVSRKALEKEKLETEKTEESKK